MNERLGVQASTWWFTPDGDGWPDRQQAIDAFQANHAGERPGWLQRVDELAWPPEPVIRPQGLSA